MISIKTDEEIELLRLSNTVVSKTLAEVSKLIRPGISTLELDIRAEEFILDNKAKPGFKGYGGFPGTLCVSINEQVVHGIPSKSVFLNEGDIVSIDCGVLLNGFYGDSAFTFPVGEVSGELKNLMKITRESLILGIENAVEGKRLGDIGNAVQKHVQQYGFSVVREMVGHGVGKSLHEEPQVPNYGKRGRGRKLKSGMVIAIEPMINMGKKDIYQAEDGWTITAKDKMPSAHYEHSVAIRKGKADILSTFEHIDNTLNNK